jgi:hypothetical protein
MKIPKVFVSYSHDSIEHKKWVLELAIRLRNNGIDAIIDQFELKAGDDLPHFMEKNLASSDRVIMVCTERYVMKANAGEGGVGYEKMIVTSDLLKRIDENKVIPIIRQTGTGTHDLPTFLKTKLFINFSLDDNFEISFDELVRDIHNAPNFVKNPVGNNPFTTIPKEDLEGDKNLLNNILKSIAEIQGLSSSASSSKAVELAGISAAFFRAAVMKLINLGYVQWDIGTTFIKVTDKGYTYLYDNNIL